MASYRVNYAEHGLEDPHAVSGKDYVRVGLGLMLVILGSCMAYALVTSDFDSWPLVREWGNSPNFSTAFFRVLTSGTVIGIGAGIALPSALKIVVQGIDTALTIRALHLRKAREKQANEKKQEEKPKAA